MTKKKLLFFKNRRLSASKYVINPVKIFLTIYVVNLGLDLAVGLFFRFRASPIALEADEREYFDIAYGLLSGAGELTPRRSLGFPLLEAGVQYFTTNFIALQSVIVAIYAMSAPLIFLLVRRLTNDSLISLYSAIAFMVWPPALYYGISLYSEAVALPIFLLSLVLLPIGSRIIELPAFAGFWAFASGICLGLTTHVRPMYLLFLPVAFLIVVLEERRIVTACARFALIVAGFAMLIAPWSIYMSTRYHHTIVVTSNGGETLAGGLNPKLLTMQHNRPIQLADRTTWAGPGKWLTIGDNGYLTADEQRLPYDQVDAILKTRTWRWVESHWGDAAYLELSKLRYMWGLSSMTDNDLHQTIFGAIPTIVLLLASIACWIVYPDMRMRYPRLWLLPLFVSGVALISWGSWRFRQVGDAGLIAFCVIGLLRSYSAPYFRRDKPIISRAVE